MGSIFDRVFSVPVIMTELSYRKTFRTYPKFFADFVFVKDGLSERHNERTV